MEKPSPVQILSTRALGNGVHDFINQQNWRVDIVSMIETHGIVTVDQIKAILADIQLGSPKILLTFSSDKGVKWLKWGLDKFGFSLPAGLRAVCVGEKTGKVAAEWLGIECVWTEKDASALLNTVRDVVKEGTSFLFLCSNKHLDILPSGIKAAGFPFKEYIIYETQLTPHKLAKTYDAILFFSPSAVESYFLVNNWNQEMVAVSIGHTTSAALQHAGVQKLIIANHPSESSMMEALQFYLKDGIK